MKEFQSIKERVAEFKAANYPGVSDKLTERQWEDLLPYAYKEHPENSLMYQVGEATFPLALYYIKTIPSSNTLYSILNRLNSLI